MKFNLMFDPVDKKDPDAFIVEKMENDDFHYKVSRLPQSIRSS